MTPPTAINTEPARLLVAAVVSALCGLLVYCYLLGVAFTRVDNVEILYETQSDTVVRLYFGNGIQSRVAHTWENSQAQPAYAGGERLLILQSKNKSLRNASLELGSPGKFQIRKISLYNRVSQTRMILKPDQILETISATGPTASIYQDGGNLVITTDQPNTRLRFHFPHFQGSAPLMLYGLTTLAVLITFLFVLRFSPLSIPAIRDINRSAVGQSKHRVELDGLRGIAALLVLLEHTWWRFAGSGATGVWIFFALSGYLLSQPFTRNPALATEIKFLINYLFRRLSRILPMYYVTLILIFGITQQTQLLFNHILFIQAEGHLWTIPQEVFFYLALPVIVVVLYFLSKLPSLILLAVFTCITAVFLVNPTIIGVKLYGYDRYTPPYLGWFMCGMLVAYLHHWIEEKKFALPSGMKSLLSLGGLILLFLLLAGSSSWIALRITGRELFLPTDYKAAFVIASSILMFIVLLCPGTLLSRILSLWPLRAIGIVGYSYYLLHPLIIEGVMAFSNQYFDYELLHGRLFIVSGIVTWLVCLFTYSLIERPFLLKKKEPAAD